MVLYCTGSMVHCGIVHGGMRQYLNCRWGSLQDGTVYGTWLCTAWWHEAVFELQVGQFAGWYCGVWYMVVYCMVA